jgi:hypothetical protein
MPILAGSVRKLREALADADSAYRAASTAELERTAYSAALLAILQFGATAVPAIESRALTRLFEDLADLTVGLSSEALKASSRHKLMKSAPERARDALIAVACQVLTEGGKRASNMSRKEAADFICTKINKLKPKDRKGKKFTGERVLNIYLETIKVPPQASPARRAASTIEIASTTAHSRMATLSNLMFREQMHLVAAWRTAGERAGRPVAVFKTIAARKKFATALIEQIPQVIEPHRTP